MIPDTNPVVAAVLITVHATVHSNPGASATIVKVKKVKPLNMSSAGTSKHWQYFTSLWEDYVRAKKLAGSDRVIQLLECCDEQLCKDLTRTADGTLADKTEGEVLEAIRDLAVREENTMVAWVTLHNMQQDRDEPVHAFGASLRGQAGVCKFTIPYTGCGVEVKYTDVMLQDMLCCGLGDLDIRLDLLSDKNQDKTMEQVFSSVEAKEVGKCSATHLLAPQRTDALSKSTYLSGRW